MEESPFARGTIFWKKVMDETAKRWPTHEEFVASSVRELIDCCFEVHISLLQEQRTEVLREVIREAHEMRQPYLPPYDDQVAGRNMALHDLILALHEKLNNVKG